jgi:hypothetical protein
MFHQTAGLSFTFIAVEGNAPKAQFDKASQGHMRHAEWKAHSNNEGTGKTLGFEREFMKHANSFKTTRVEVHELRAGQSLIFAASTSYHASIIPAQAEETRRALLVFHSLETAMTLQQGQKRKDWAKGAGEKPNDPMTELIGGTAAVTLSQLRGAETGAPQAKKPETMGLETQPASTTLKVAQNKERGAPPEPAPKDKCSLMGMACSDQEKLGTPIKTPLKMKDIEPLLQSF